MASITQDMRYRLSLIRFAEKYGVSKTAIKYKTNRQYIYRKRQILMRSDTKLPQPFASWSNSL